MMTEPASEVITAVATEFGVMPGQLLGHSRRYPLMPARRVAYLLLHETGMPWSEVARTMRRSVSGDIRSAARIANPYRAAAARARLRTVWPERRVQ